MLQEDVLEFIEEDSSMLAVAEPGASVQNRNGTGTLVVDSPSELSGDETNIRIEDVPTLLNRIGFTDEGMQREVLDRLQIPQSVLRSAIDATLTSRMNRTPAPAQSIQAQPDPTPTPTAATPSRRRGAPAAASKTPAKAASKTPAKAGKAPTASKAPVKAGKAPTASKAPTRAGKNPFKGLKVNARSTPLTLKAALEMVAPDLDAQKELATQMLNPDNELRKSYLAIHTACKATILDKNLRAFAEGKTEG